MVLLSVTLDFVQEYRAGKAAEKLRLAVVGAGYGGARRQASGGPGTEVVPGDVVVLSAGDLVPADGVVLEARDFFVNQALLTGEPYPGGKAIRRCRPPMRPICRMPTNAVFMGTSVISGSARVLVVKTGTATAIGAIADSA